MKIICSGCKKDDRLYEDSHGVFCERCGPSVPITRGFFMAKATMQAYVDGKPVGKEYRVRDTSVWIEESA
ncbi:hypothetical protein B9J07_27760 [Sinorhizobium sp. LM21]|uniref:hypothetical protein n=1 Tax=Sinorhizobium sp. LM21 TaxID=1449788 RepID=UPI0005D8DC16|nr:hypothetical protein [Sinorhizobium sp. LM21]AJW30210.1 hypothetical protein pLM21S1_p90 [Sinorhizobium sp. LM21]OWZ90386.1 hypothetical protein B9J07_27760 [Sinorhizobium sp. LM21]